MHTYLVLVGLTRVLKEEEAEEEEEEEKRRIRDGTIARKLFTTKQSTKPERNAALKEWQNNYKL